MSIQIEEGKFYRRRDGIKAGPMGASGGKHFRFRDANNGKLYTCWGSYWGDATVDNRDLIAEWVDEPVASEPAPEQPAKEPDSLERLQALTDAEIAAEQPDVKAEIADEAKRIVSGARRSAYGKPEQNFERIARFWQAYFENTGRGAVNITAADVSPMMRLMKEGRLCETPDHRDSFVDLVGYTLTGAEVNGVKPA